MSKNKLCTPLSTLITRTLTSSTSIFPPHVNKLPVLHRASPSPHPTFDHPHSLACLRFSDKTFCSKPAAETQRGCCWSCRAVPCSAPFLVCDSCRCVQPIDGSVDYFEIFGLERKYDMEGENLEGKYKEWQKKLHPDLVHSKSQMKLYGVEIDEEQTISDPELLAEIMDIREAVEEASTPEALNLILSQMHEKMQNWSNAFSHAFQSQSFEEAKLAIRRMTYYTRVIDEVVKKL